jgi:acyl transferase domain-containing protein
MNQPTVFMVPGQGVQYPGMVGDLYEQNDEFRFHLDHLLAQTPAHLTKNLYTFIKNEPRVGESVLKDCRLTHPLIFIVHFAIAKTVQSNGIQPDYVLGYSLGELTASVINGSISFEKGLQLAVDTGAWVADHTPERHMMAILSAPDICYACYPFFKSVTVACLNYSKHFVITGSSHEIEAIANELRNEGIHFEFLPINRGFHSSAMDSLRQQAAEWSQSIEWREAHVPMISCTLGKIASRKDLEDNHLGNIHRQTVRFADTLHAVEHNLEPKYIDLSVTGTLAAFARKIIKPARKSAIHTVHSRFSGGNKHFENFLEQWNGNLR